MLVLLVLLLPKVFVPLEGRVALREANGEESLSLRGEPSLLVVLLADGLLAGSPEVTERMKEDFVAGVVVEAVEDALGMVVVEVEEIGDVPDEADREARAGKIGFGEVGGGGSSFLPGRVVDVEAEVVVVPADPNTTPSCRAKGEIGVS